MSSSIFHDVQQTNFSLQLSFFLVFSHQNLRHNVCLFGHYIRGRCSHALVHTVLNRAPCSGVLWSCCLGWRVGPFPPQVARWSLMSKDVLGGKPADG